MKKIIYWLLLVGFAITGCNPVAHSSFSTETSTPQGQVEVATATVLDATSTPLSPATDIPPTSTTAATATTVPTPTADTRPLPETWREWPVIPEPTHRVAEIYAIGQTLGADPHHFSKIGDCQNVRAAFMGLFDKPGWYKLREGREHLQATIDWFGGSFDRDGMAVKGGFNAAAVLSPIWADPQQCQPGENPVECELRTHNPSFAIVSLEYWWQGRTTEKYEEYMRTIIETLIEHGVVPILATKADNIEGDHALNLMTAQLAYEYDIPLWNFWREAQELPYKGMDPERNDGFHISYLAWTVRSFSALETLDKMWVYVNQAP